MAKDEDNVWTPQPRQKAGPALELGQPLDALSLHEIDERVALLQAEIERLQAARVGKAASRLAADSVFKL